MPMMYLFCSLEWPPFAKRCSVAALSRVRLSEPVTLYYSTTKRVNDQCWCDWASNTTK